MFISISLNVKIFFWCNSAESYLKSSTPTWRWHHKTIIIWKRMVYFSEHFLTDKIFSLKDKLTFASQLILLKSFSSIPKILKPKALQKQLSSKHTFIPAIVTCSWRNIFNTFKFILMVAHLTPHRLSMATNYLRRAFSFWVRNTYIDIVLHSFEQNQVRPVKRELSSYRMALGFYRRMFLHINRILPHSSSFSVPITRKVSWEHSSDDQDVFFRSRCVAGSL